jgi:hypothetical protein
VIADAWVGLNGATRVLLVAGGSTTELSATDARLLGSWPVMPVDKHESSNSEPLPTDFNGTAGQHSAGPTSKMARGPAKDFHQLLRLR